MSKALREPIFHFALIGLALLLFDNLWPSPEASVVLSPSIKAELIANYTKRHNTPPTPYQRRALFEQYQREEVLVLEALRLGLERGDPIIRRRLVQSMEFFIQDTSLIEKPDAQTLKTYLRNNQERYTTPATLDFEHHFYPHHLTADQRSNALSCYAALGEQGSCPGHPFIHGQSFSGTSKATLKKRFGQKFTEALWGSRNQSGWLAPMESLYGWHVVKVNGQEPAYLPAFQQLLPQLKRDYLIHKREEAFRLALGALKKRYGVTSEPLPSSTGSEPS